jgi:hypothetical protein
MSSKIIFERFLWFHNKSKARVRDLISRAPRGRDDWNGYMAFDYGFRRIGQRYVSVFRPSVKNNS